MSGKQTLIGLAIFLFGLLNLIENKPLTKLGCEISERLGSDWLPFSWCRAMTIIGGGLMAVGGLLMMLNLMQIPVK